MRSTCTLYCNTLCEKPKHGRTGWDFRRHQQFCPCRWRIPLQAVGRPRDIFLRGVPISNQPTVTLRSTWEDGTASDEENKHYHRMKYATKDGHAWKVTIQDRGGGLRVRRLLQQAVHQRRSRLPAPSPEGRSAGRETLVRPKALGGLVDEYKRSVHFPTRASRWSLGTASTPSPRPPDRVPRRRRRHEGAGRAVRGRA